MATGNATALRIGLKILFRMVACVYSVVAMFCIGMVLATGLLIRAGRPLPVPVYPLVVAAILAISIALCTAVMLACRKWSFDTRGFLRGGALTGLTILLCRLIIDGQPGGTDYTYPDFLRDTKEDVAAHNDLLTLSRLDPALVFLNSNFDYQRVVTNVQNETDLIARVWAGTAQARAVVEKLDDATHVPDMIPDATNGASRISCGRLPANLTDLYHARVLLLVQQGAPDDAAKLLRRYHSFTRKALEGSVCSRGGWQEAARRNIVMAHWLLHKAGQAEKTAAIIKNGFSPLSLADISGICMVKSAYVQYCGSIEAEVGPSTWHTIIRDQAGSRTDGFWRWPETGSRQMAALLNLLIYKANESRNMLRLYMKLEIAGAEDCPPDFSRARRFLQKFNSSPWIGNPGGWYLLHKHMKECDYGMPEVFEVKVLSDLLFVELCNKGGEECPMTDPYAGKPYQIEEKSGELFSVGVDRAPGTADDIRLDSRQNLPGLK